MKCPIDDTDLVMSDRQGIEIDYCPKCRGVWLDRGELDKIIERSAPNHAPEPIRNSSDRHSYENERRPDHRDHDYRYDRPKKKKSILSELFDF